MVIKPAGIAVLILGTVGLVGYGMNEYLTSRPNKAESVEDSIKWQVPAKVSIPEVSAAVDVVKESPKNVIQEPESAPQEQSRNAGLEALLKAKK